MSGTALRQRVSWPLWPLAALWDALAFLMIALGRVLTGIFGFLLLALGVTLSLTVVAAPVGIPLAAVGFLLLVRSLF